MRVEWQVGETPRIPPDVTTIVLRYRENNGAWGSTTTVTVEALPFESSGGRYADVELLRNLPTGSAIEVEVRGIRADGLAGYIGFAGPLVFRPGERRYVQLRMYEIGVSTPLSFAEAGGRFLHTSTALPDGRVLITGGFTSIGGVPCPADVPGGSVCHQVTASNSALVFVPSSGLFYEVIGGMAEPRAGHTATALPDGRVLIAGGAPSALLALAPNGDTFEAIFRPLNLAGAPGASATFEVFLPETPTEEDDVDGDGDPGRGSFLPPGGLNRPRFLHAATRLEGTNKVVVAGGLSRPGDFEVFDEDAFGNVGFYPIDGPPLLTARAWPSALALQNRVWIVGGVLSPSGNQDLAEIWQETNPDAAVQSGSVLAASATAFPNMIASDPTPRPGLSLRRPAVTAAASGTLGVVAGWLGPLCETGTDTETFFTATATLCGTSPAIGSRSFVINAVDGSARPLELSAEHSFGAAVTLTTGDVAIAGGLTAETWARTGIIDLFVPGGAGTLLPRANAQLEVARAFHTAAPLPNGGLFVAGGLALSDDFINAALVATAEVLYLELPP